MLVLIVGVTKLSRIQLRWQTRRLSIASTLMRRLGSVARIIERRLGAPKLDMAMTGSRMLVPVLQPEKAMQSREARKYERDRKIRDSDLVIL